jgi:SAM-dependent methyltransferase
MDDWLDFSYDRFARIEDDLGRALDESLGPRGPEQLYEVVASFGLAAGSAGLDVGCGEGGHTAELVRRFGFEMLGLDPVPRHVELARAAHPEARFEQGRAEELPLGDGVVDVVWCRDVLVHVSDLGRAYGELARVLRPGGYALVYAMVAGPYLEPADRRLLAAAHATDEGLDAAAHEAAAAAAGLSLQSRLEIGSKWGEWAQERDGKPGSRLLRAARLLREPDRYVSRFGRDVYELALADCLWHVFAMVGKLDRRAWVFTAG